MAELVDATDLENLYKNLSIRKKLIEKVFRFWLFYSIEPYLSNWKGVCSQNQEKFRSFYNPESSY